MSRVQLSQPLSAAKDGYEIVVIGSGYGAAIAASRLARAGREVAVLERGREIRPGEYPRGLADIAAEGQVQVAATGQRMGRLDGLFDFHLNPDLSVLVGCGLGGTSLINANVALQSDVRVTDDWPLPFRGNRDLLTPYYARARRALGSTPYPMGAPDLPKLTALQQSAEALGLPFYRPDLNVTFADGPNDFGFAQSACTLCGDCCTGCNYGAKNTVLMNYLPDARAHGAQIFTGAEVRHLEKTASGWRVHLEGRIIAAELVVLGAGTLGSTEILLRSRERGLALSPMLGKRFSGNGDVIAFGYNANLGAVADGGVRPALRPTLRGVGAGINTADRPEFKPGPCIAGVIDARGANAPLQDGMIIQEGVIPGGLGLGVSGLFFFNNAMTGDPFRFGDAGARLQDARLVGEALTTNPAALGQFAYDGPMARTQTYLVMGHDDADGEVVLRHDAAVVDWPGAGKSAAILRDTERLAAAADAIWAEFQPNPLWQTDMGRKLVSVHPLGGCVMGDTAAQGVVSGACEVFDGAGGGVHAGLYVCDGAVVPGALGVNPLLTICAVAEYAVERLAQARGWVVDYDSRKPLPAACFVPEVVAVAVQDGLQDVIDAMVAARARIMASDFAGARGVFAAAYAKADVGLPWAIVSVFLTDNLMRSLGEVFDDFLPLLEAVDACLDAGDFAGALAVVEDAVGDFTPGLRFDERMAGAIDVAAPGVSEPYKVAARRGDSLVAQFTISTDSTEALRDDPNHRAVLTGSLDCDALGGRMVFAEGATFDLLRPEMGAVDCWQMIYAGIVEGGTVLAPKTWYFRGIKTLKRRAGSTWWGDLTTLEVDIWQGPVPGGVPAFQGVMTLNLQDLAQQLGTVQAPMEQNVWAAGVEIAVELIGAQWQGDLAARLRDQGLRALMLRQGLVMAARMGHGGLLQLLGQSEALRLGALFAGLVFRSYGGVTAYLNNFCALDDAVAVAPRMLALPEAEGFALTSGALTRYRGGARGPVILAPGFGVVAASYAMDTTAQSFAEFLVEHGFDVWLFDPRGSPAVAASRKAFTIDDIARQDWPEAVETVRRVTGAVDVQVVAHCFGSTSVLMALLAGMKGVRSVISSQTSLHPVTSWFNYAKADGGVASLLAHGVPKSMVGLLGQMGLPKEVTGLLETGLHTVDMRSITDPNAPGFAAAKALDAMLWRVPFPGEVPCYNPVCHRVFGIFGASYAHAQLNEATHDALGRIFGEISTAPFLQLSQILRFGHVVDAQGGDTYMNHPENIDIPIDFVAGGQNRIFLPETTLRTLHWLRATHPDAAKGMFTRHVFEDYAHLDLFIGKRAHLDIYPYLLERLAAREGGQADA